MKATYFTGKFKSIALAFALAAGVPMLMTS